MSYSDFLQNWDYVEMVHLTIDAFSGEILNDAHVNINGFIKIINSILCIKCSYSLLESSYYVEMQKY
jgi:hypothetical protein